MPVSRWMVPRRAHARCSPNSGARSDPKGASEGSPIPRAVVPRSLSSWWRSSCPPVASSGLARIVVPLRANGHVLCQRIVLHQGFHHVGDASCGTLWYDVGGTPLPDFGRRTTPLSSERWLRATPVPSRTATDAHLCSSGEGTERGPELQKSAVTGLPSAPTGPGLSQRLRSPSPHPR